MKDYIEKAKEIVGKWGYEEEGWWKPIAEGLKRAYEMGKEEKLSSTYKSSKMYLMGFNDGRREILKEIEEMEDKQYEQRQILESIKVKLKVSQAIDNLK